MAYITDYFDRYTIVVVDFKSVVGRGYYILIVNIHKLFIY